MHLYCLFAYTGVGSAGCISPGLCFPKKQRHSQMAETINNAIKLTQEGSITMLEGINKTMLEGFVGNDVHFRFLPSGVACASFDLGTTRIWIDKASGERKSHTEWHKIVCWNKAAEWVRDNVKVGQLVWADGEIRYRDYQKENVTVRVAEVHARVSIRNWESKEDRNGRAVTPAPAAQTNAQNSQAKQVDIPF